MAALRRQAWPTAVAGALVGLVLAGVLGGVRTGTFWSEVRVALDPTQVGVSVGERASTVTLDSEAQVVTSAGVIDPVADRLSFPDGSVGLREALTVGAVPNSRILVLRVSTGSSTLAEHTIDALTDEFLAARSEAASQRAAAAVRVLDGQVEEVTGQLTVLRAARTVEDSATESLPLTQERVLGEQLTALQGELASVQATTGAAGATVVDRRSGEEPRTVLLVSGTLLGLLVALVARWSSASRRRRT